jgi:hypothetical protein
MTTTIAAVLSFVLIAATFVTADALMKGPIPRGSGGHTGSGGDPRNPPPVCNPQGDPCPGPPET